MRALLVFLKCASCLVHTRFHAAPRRVALRAASDAASDAAPARSSAAAAPAAARRKNDTLTTEGLGKMLAEVRAHYREPFAASPNSTEAVAEAARVKKRLLRTRFQDLELDRCAVGKSAIHGRGLFATRDIAPGELVTLYPGDALLSWPDGDAASRSAGCEIKALFGSHVPNDEQTAEDLFVRAANARDPGQQKRATFPTSKAPFSAVFHSFRLIFGRAIIPRSGFEEWMLFPERAHAEHSL